MNRARRELATAVVACALGAAVVLFAAGRPWRIESAKGAVALPENQLTGTTLVPWLPAVALVGLAGAGALLAVRGRARTLLGSVLVLAGALVIGAGVYGVAHASGGRAAYPILVTAGGLLLGVAGIRATVRGASWPALGGRYERTGTTGTVEYVERSGPSRSDVAMWDALDRGEDPTTRA